MNQPPDDGAQGPEKADGPRRPSRLQWAVLAGAALLALSFLISSLFSSGGDDEELEISEVLRMAEEGTLQAIEVQGDKLRVTTVDGAELDSRKETSISIVELLDQRGVDTGPDGLQITVKKESGGGFLPVLVSLLPVLLIGGLIFYFFRRSQGGIRQALGVGKSPAREIAEDRPDVTFDDVAGAEEAKQELMEVVEFLNDSAKFTKLGAKIPKGVLLVGPPGTGKTLIGRAVAGEAGVPFFSTSGSAFVEMFVGVGASRVRDLFARAKERAPAVVFIDEIDAIGRRRGLGSAEATTSGSRPSTRSSWRWTASTSART